MGIHAGIPFFKHLAEVFQSGDHVVAGRPRFRSTMENPNTAAHFMVASLAATIAVGVLRKAQLPALWLAAAGAQTVAIFLTYSRGALGSAFLALLTGLWLFRHAFVKKWWRWAVAATLAVLLAGIGYAVRLRFARSNTQTAVSTNTIARYSFPTTPPVRYLTPNENQTETMIVRNESSNRWEADRTGVSYRWFSFGTGKQTALIDGATFTSDILPGEERRVDAILKTPAGAGEYTLVWFVVRRDSEIKELDRSHSIPQLIIVHDARNGPPPLPTRENWRLAQNLKHEREASIQNRVPDRWSLWAAALRMFRERPWFGLGPDSFRLLKWKYMDFPGGDDTILSNSLYLEFLAGSGLIGLLSLLWLLFEIGRILWNKLGHRLSPDDRAIAFYGVAYFLAFMLHGSVDYFLKFTPTFLLFWISLGVVCASDNDSDENRF
jgi:hypothetical protein